MHPKQNSRRVILAVLFGLALVAGAIFLLTKNTQDAAINDTQTPTESSATEPEVESNVPSVTIPPTLQLNVSFTAQAPTANWDELHNDACEEASVIMAWAYFNNITSLPPATVEREIDKLTEFQQTNFGYYLSVTTEETARMAREVYGLKTEIAAYSTEAIKQALAEDKLVIVPAQGQLLGNPNFRAPGPPYHMLVVTGWDSTHFITNDPGTRNGFNYRYSFEVLRNAAGNYSHTTKTVDTSEKEIIIVSK